MRCRRLRDSIETSGVETSKMRFLQTSSLKSAERPFFERMHILLRKRIVDPADELSRCSPS